VGFISDAINSAVTPRGTNAAQGQQDQYNNAQNIFSGALGNYSKLLNNQIGTANSLYPQYTDALNSSLSSLGQPAVDANVRSYSNNANENAFHQGMLQNLFARAQGEGSGVTQGQDQGAAQQAAIASNNYNAQLNSPQAHAQRYNMIMDLLQKGMSPTAISGALQLSSGVYGAPRVQVQQGIGSSLGSLLGGIGGIGGLGSLGSTGGFNAGAAGQGVGSDIGSSLGAFF